MFSPDSLNIRSLQYSMDADRQWYKRRDIQRDSQENTLILLPTSSVPGIVSGEEYTLIWNVQDDGEETNILIPISGVGEAGLTQVDLILTLMTEGELVLQRLPSSVQGHVLFMMDELSVIINSAANLFGYDVIIEERADDAPLRFPTLRRSEEQRIPANQVLDIPYVLAAEETVSRFLERRNALELFIDNFDQIADVHGLDRDQIREELGEIQGLRVTVFGGTFQLEGRSTQLHSFLGSIQSEYPEFKVLGDRRKKWIWNAITLFEIDNHRFIIETGEGEIDVLRAFFSVNEPSSEISYADMLGFTPLIGNHERRKYLQRIAERMRDYGYTPSVEKSQVTIKSQNGKQIIGFRLPLPVLNEE